MNLNSVFRGMQSEEILIKFDKQVNWLVSE